MKRRHFLMLSALAASPVMSYAYYSRNDRPKKGIKVASGKSRFGEEIKLQGVNQNDNKVSGKDTNGDLAVFEYTGMVKGGPPMHVHLDQDEVFYVIAGVYLFKIGEDTFEAKAGDTLFGPRGVPHTWIQLGDTPGKLVYVVQPAGKMEEFFQKISSLQGIPTQAEIEKIHLEHGMKVVGPPLAIK